MAERGFHVTQDSIATVARMIAPAGIVRRENLLVATNQEAVTVAEQLLGNYFTSHFLGGNKDQFNDGLRSVIAICTNCVQEPTGISLGQIDSARKAMDSIEQDLWRKSFLFPDTRRDNMHPLLTEFLTNQVAIRIDDIDAAASFAAGFEVGWRIVTS